MIAVWVFVGVAVGFSYSLTGVGGAIISMPLLIHLGGFSVREATELSLLPVALGAFTNLFLHRHMVQWREGLTIALIASVAALPTSVLKNITPPLLIKLMFLGVCLISFYKVVAKGKFSQPTSAEHLKLKLAPSSPLLLLLIGCVQGFLITMTGLGGGIILIPFLLGPLKYPPQKAVATTILAITVASLGSTYAQWERVKNLLDLEIVFTLALSIILTSQMTQRILKKLPEATVGKLRTSIYGFIILLSIIGVAVG